MKYFGGKVFDGKGVVEFFYLFGRYFLQVWKLFVIVRDNVKFEIIRYFNV